MDSNDPALGLDTKVVLFGLRLGAGLEVSRFFNGFSYQVGLSSMDDTGENNDIKNRVLAIVAGYGFGLGH